MKRFFLAAVLLLACGAAHAQDFGHSMPWDDDQTVGRKGEAETGANAGQVFSRGNVQVGEMRIRTSRPACLLTAGFPVVRALVEPPDMVGALWLNFRPEGGPLWYQVAMRRSGEGFVGVLPKPRPSARRVLYFVQVTPLSGPPRRGNEIATTVVENPAQCPGALAETVETAAIGVRVPKGAPAVPPVPPGFEPVGVADITAAHGSRATPMLLGAGFAGTLGALFATGHGTVASAGAAPNEITFRDSIPPPGSHVSLSAAPQLTVRLGLRMHQGMGAGGAVRVTLLRSGAAAPCAVLEAPIGAPVAPGDTAQELNVSGPLKQAQVCQPSDRLRVELLQNGTVVIGPGQPDTEARYFIDP